MSEQKSELEHAFSRLLPRHRVGRALLAEIIASVLELASEVRRQPRTMKSDVDVETEGRKYTSMMLATQQTDPDERLHHMGSCHFKSENVILLEECVV